MDFDVNACTDITGFGIIGHALEMAKGSRVGINLFYNKLPFYPNARLMYRKREKTGSNKDNRKLAGGFLKIDATLTREEEELLFDPQTSGGLLISVPSSQVESLVEKLKDAGIPSAVCIGEAVSSKKPVITVC